MLVWFRERRDMALAERGFGISQATAYWYLDEAIEVLVAQASELTEVLERVAADGRSHVILNGKVVADPGSVHDLTVARAHVPGALYAAASTLNLPTLADGGYDGAGAGVHTPVKQPTDGTELDIDTRTYNMLLRSIRCLGERGFALLAGRWRTLQHVTVSPSKIGTIAQAALVLTHFEHSYPPC